MTFEEMSTTWKKEELQIKYADKAESLVYVNSLH